MSLHCCLQVDQTSVETCPQQLLVWNVDDLCCNLQGMMDDPVTVEQFCRRYVEPMGEESDHIHIVAMTDALQVGFSKSPSLPTSHWSRNQCWSL